MTISTISRTLGMAFVALAFVLSAAAPAVVSAADLFGGYDDYYGGDYSYGYDDYYGGDYSYGYDDYYGGDYSYAYDDYYGGDYSYAYDDYYGGDYEYAYDDYYGGDYDYAYDDSYGYGGSGSGFSMPSFGGGSYGGGSSYYPYFPSYTPSKSSSYSYTNLEYCKNNSCNSYVDNSVKVNNSFNNQKKQQYNDCYDYGYGYNQYGYGDGYDQVYGYGQQGYNYGSYMYDGHCYNYAAPIAYNTTPYISLSQTPYTGLDLGPMGEVLYWTFLVLWCLGAAYLIVVKRVQNKLVSFLNGFLFGSTALTTGGTKMAHATHAPAHAAPVQATLVEEGIDPFIASQIKRS